MIRTSNLLKRSRPDSPNVSSLPRRLAIVSVGARVESRLLAAVLRKYGYEVVEEAHADLSGVQTSSAKVELIVVDDSWSAAELEAFEIRTPAPTYLVICQPGSPRREWPTHWYSVERPLEYSRIEDKLEQIQARHRTTALSAARARTRASALSAAMARSEPADEDSGPNGDLLTDLGSTDSTTADPIHHGRAVGSQAALLYREAFDYLSLCIDTIKQGESLDLGLGFGIARRLVDRLQESDKDLLVLATDRSSSYSWRQHSINVGVIAAHTARTLQLDAETVLKVCFAGMMHDIGTLKLRAGVIAGGQTFGPDEREHVRLRPTFSAELLSGYPAFEWLPPIVESVCELENGLGYPHGLVEDQIPLESKLLGAADLFEAFIHPRPQRPALTGHAAMKAMTGTSTRFAERITLAMIRGFSVYPYNEHVVINTGEIGIVVDVNLESPTRPVVQIVSNGDGKGSRRQDTRIDLSGDPRLWIVRSITLAEAEELTPRDGLRNDVARTKDLNSSPSVPGAYS